MPLAALTTDGLLALQRAAGNRATSQLLQVQRDQGDAERYAKRFGILGDEMVIDADVVAAFVGDPLQAPGLRLGLLREWNRGLPRGDQLPESLVRREDKRPREAPDADEGSEADEASEADDRPSAAAKRRRKRGTFWSNPFVSGYDSDNKTKAPEKRVREDRGYISDGFEAKTGLDARDYRGRKVRLTFKKSKFRATSAANSNLVYSSGNKDTHYDVLITTLRRLVKRDKTTAELMLKGLLDMPAFHAAVDEYKDEKTRNTIQQFLALLFNEMLGRSTANIIDIVALLSQTVKKDDNRLDRRFLARALLTPNSKDHAKAFGGSQFSKIGSANKDVKIASLDATLRRLFAKHQQMYQSLFVRSGAASFDEFRAKVDELVKRVFDNFKRHVRMQFLS
ncbi:MAG TPA: hypothetical protein VFI15_09195 [Candidatus Limnocylindrales bacterium]|nr:hypothetical protein [Candidatus Limnocylindrales bacterium]